MLSNATNQPKSTVELGYMCPRPPAVATCALGDSLVHQQWHSPSSWNMKRDFYLDVYTILNRINMRISGTEPSSVILTQTK